MTGVYEEASSREAIWAAAWYDVGEAATNAARSSMWEAMEVILPSPALGKRPPVGVGAKNVRAHRQDHHRGRRHDHRHPPGRAAAGRHELSLIHISEPTRRTPISYAVFCLKKKKKIKK